MEKVRIQKYLSNSGIISRRAAEKYILEARITINGLPAKIGDTVDPSADIVKIDGKAVESQNEYIYIALNKPVGYVTTMSDDKDRRDISALLKNINTRIYPVGRLDMYSEGLLICTNDGEVANKLMHPSHSISKSYITVVTTEVTPDQLEELSEPFEIDGYFLKPYEVELIGHLRAENNKTFSSLRFTLHEGRNREIRKICAHNGLKVAKLTRISVGPVELGNLPSGKWRYLTDEEIKKLKEI